MREGSQFGCDPESFLSRLHFNDRPMLGLEADERPIWNGRRNEWESGETPPSGSRRRPKLLTVDGDIDLLLLGVFPAADVTRVRAPVRLLEPGEGQDVVEQHVCRVFHQPLGCDAAVASL